MESNVTVSSCVFEDNFAEKWGGGIFGQNSTVIVRDTIFRRCRAGFTPSAGDNDDENIDGSGGGIAVSYEGRGGKREPKPNI